MQQMLMMFWTVEDGAVTVDWVVLCAAVIGVGMLVLTPIAFSADSSAQKISESIANLDSGYGKN
jgi:hypothetical protein